MFTAAIGIIIFSLVIWFCYIVFKSHKNNDTLKLDINKSEIKPDLYSYIFPELLKQRYMKERNRTEEQYEKVQLALKDWFSIFAFCTNRKEFYEFPSKEVDELWHLFILFTADYREFCQKYLGQFLDHVPLDNSNSNCLVNLTNLFRTFKAVKNKNDCLLFKIDDMFNIKNEHNYNFMNELYRSYIEIPEMRTKTEANKLYLHGIISYTESKKYFQYTQNTQNATKSSKPSTVSTKSSTRTDNTSSDDIITAAIVSTVSSCGSSCGSSSSSSCGSSGCGS